MDITTLEKANELNKKIKNLSEVIYCLSELHPEHHNQKMRRNPRLIIEHDGPDEREQIPLSMELNGAFISFVKKKLIETREAAVKEFNEL